MEKPGEIVGLPNDAKLLEEIWNPIVLPEGWTLETLLGEHSSAPYNPTIANAFFRSGEIEAWGRGIQRIFEACHSAGTPEPQLRITGHDLWLEFPFSSEYLTATRRGSNDARASGLDEKLDNAERRFSD